MRPLPPITASQWGARARIAMVLREQWLPEWLTARGNEMPRSWAELIDPVGPRVEANGLVFRARVDGVISIVIERKTGETVACALIDGPSVSATARWSISYLDAIKVLNWARRLGGTNAKAERSAIEFLAESYGFGARAVDPKDPWHIAARDLQIERAIAAEYEARKAAELARVTKR